MAVGGVHDGAALFACAEFLRPQFDMGNMFHNQEDWTEITENVKNYRKRLVTALAAAAAVLVAMIWGGVALVT